jgi:hypothetical protein
MNQMLKSIEMLTSAYLKMEKDGKGDFTSDRCEDELKDILNNIPGPDELKEVYKKKQQEN